MKYIEKSLKNEPTTLKEYRETTVGASYKGFGDTDQKLKKSLLKEQGEICAYCMQRISLKQNHYLKKPRIEVEHILSQKNHPEKSLDFYNMVGVCNGNLGGIEHCDKSKKDSALGKLLPTNKNCESLISYSISGKVQSIANNKEIEMDINNLLNLNNQNLIDMRKSAIDLLVEQLKKIRPVGDWDTNFFNKFINLYRERNKKGQFKEFCNYVIWYLEKLKNKPKYANRN